MRVPLDVILEAGEEEGREEELRQEQEGERQEEHVAEEEAKQDQEVRHEEVRQVAKMEVDIPWDEGVNGGEGAKEEEDDGGDDDEAIDVVERLLRWSMVEGEEEISSGSPLPHDATTD